MQSFYRENEDKKFARMLEQTVGKSLQERQQDIRRNTGQNGTQWSLNDADPVGDGDQSPLDHLSEAGKLVYRDLYSSGGDMTCIDDVAEDLPAFFSACLFGSHATVEKMLKKADRPGKPPEDLLQLLETRELAIRMSPLLLLVAMGKNLQKREEFLQNQLKVARILLEYGARPDAKDISGMTVCHYGAGSMATPNTLAMVELCMKAFESSHLFGKEVEIFGLEGNKSMNGKRAIARGFQSDTSRRLVYLIDDSRLVSIKPQNLRLVSHEHDIKQSQVPRMKLCDIQDRLGGVCLLDAFRGNREDVGIFLVEKHGASVDVADYDGFSPKLLAFGQCGRGFGEAVAPIIRKVVISQARSERNQAEEVCAKCRKANAKLLCSRCQSANYCSADCQRTHWRQGHKRDCDEICVARDRKVVVQRPSGDLLDEFIAMANLGTFTFSRPRHVAVGETFCVKVQCAGDLPLLVYDRTRECQFGIPPDNPAYDEIREEVLRETATMGTKAYFRASFDEAEECTIYLGYRTLKKW